MPTSSEAPHESQPLLNDDAINASTSEDTTSPISGKGLGLRKKQSSQFLPWRRKPVPRNTLPDDVERNSRKTTDATAAATAFRTHSFGAAEPSFRERLAFYVDTSSAGRYWEAFDLLLNVAFVSLYIYNTGYLPNGEVPSENHQLDCLLATIILVQWLPRSWLSLDPAAAASLFGFVTLVSTVPVILVHYFFRAPNTYMSAGNFVILYPFRFWRLHINVLKLVRPNRQFFFRISAVTQKGIAIALTIFNLLLTVTAFVHMVERTQSKADNLYFWEVYYWIFVTSSSGLSTKIVPDDTISRIVILYVMINGIVFLPPALTEFIELIKKRSKFVHAYKERNGKDHVVVLGDLELTSVKDFLPEHVLCLDEFKLGIIAQNCIASGFTTLINILITSIPEHSIRRFHRSYNPRKGGSWVKEYVQGLAMEIYSVRLSPCFKGMRFKVAAERVFLRHGAILFAVAGEGEVSYGETIWNDSILMNPAEYILKGGEQAYMIAGDSFTAEQVAGNAEWLFECNVDGVTEWELPWEFEDLEDEEGSASETGSWARRIGGVLAWGKRSQARGLESRDSSMGPEVPRNVESPPATTLLSRERTGQQKLADRIPARSTSLTTMKVDVNIPKRTGETESPTDEKTARSEDSPAKTRSDLVFMGSGNGAEEKAQKLELADAPEPTPIAGASSRSAAAQGKQHLNPFSMFLPPAVTETPPSPVRGAPKTSELRDHLLICSLNTERFPPSLAFLVAPIRLRYPDMAVVILTPVEPDEEARQKLIAYGMVYFVHGSALNRGDLKKCGVDGVQKAVVLSSVTKMKGVERTADAPAVLAVLNIEAMAKSSVFITVEFIHTANMKLIGSGEEYYSKIDVYGHSIMPSFASGHTYYNPHLLVILKHLIFSYRSYHPHAVRVGSTDSLATSPYDPNDAEHEAQTTEHGQIFKVKVPRRYLGQQYALLVVKCLREHSALCLALYRWEEVHGHNVRYITVNPAASERLRKGDFVFLLAHREPAL
ncbi:hypothetical protein HDU96_005446 [Phlyctochytrium bullatum]|nr:hypothetical protein HDU96_005446 [Phlyctochytrium bullatum]